MTLTATAVISIALAVCAIDARQTRDAATRPPTTAAAPTGTAVLTGTIHTDDGKPVRRAAVRLGGSDVPGGRIAVTDDAGRFAFTSLPAGSFTVFATRASYVTTYYGSKRPGRGPALPIALAAGQRLSVAMTMLRGAAIAGIITNPFGRPAPQVTVQATIQGVPAAPRLTEAAPNYTTTDDRGMFRIYGLPPGDYLVSANLRSGAADARAVTDDEVQWALRQLSPGARTGAGAVAGAAALLPPASRSVVYAPVYFPGTTEPGLATKIQLSAGEDHGGITFALQFVPTARIDGTVFGPGGQGASGVSAVLLPKSVGSAASFQAMFDAGLATIPRFLTSLDGRFSAAGVTPGQYTVVARTGENAAFRGAGPGAGTLWGETDVAVNGRDIPDLAVTLQPGAKVAGTIVFEGTSLAPPADPGVVRPSMSSSKWGATALGTPTANVTPAGAFVFPSLISGPYVIKVTPPPAPTGAPRWTLKSIVAGGRDITDGTLDLRTGDDVNGVVITFTDKETEISGTLLDAAGRPTSEFSVVVFATNRAFWTAGSRRVQSVRPATNGTYRIAGLPAGEYSMVAVTDLEPAALADPGYLEQLQAAAAARITLGEGEKKKLDVRIPGGR